MSCKFRGKYISVIPQGIAHLRFKKSGNHYTWRKVTTTVHNVVIGKLWLDQSGDMDIFNHKTKDNCHLKYAQYSYFSRETPRKVTGIVTDKSGRTHWALRGTWDNYIEYAPILDPESSSAEDPGQTGDFTTIWNKSVIDDKFDEKSNSKMYNFTRFAVELNEEEDGVAPTDSRNRPDQRLMEKGLWDDANDEKVRLEDKQRAARKNRSESEGAESSLGNGDNGWTPTWFKKEDDPNTGIPIHIYTGEYWKCKATHDWDRCPDIF